MNENTSAMPGSLTSLETFVCKAHAPKSSTRILSELPWEHFRANNLESEMLPLTVDTLVPHIYSGSTIWSCEIGVTLLRISGSRILRVMAGPITGCQSSVSYPLHPALWWNWSSVGVRENARGTVLVQIIDWPAHLFANAGSRLQQP